MRQLDYTVPLYSEANKMEVHRLLQTIEDINWNLVSIRNCSRDPENPRPRLSPGRADLAAGDYVWLNTSTGQRCTRDEAKVGQAP